MWQIYIFKPSSFSGLGHLEIDEVEKFRFIPRFTGLFKKVQEINKAWDKNYQEDEFSPSRE